MIRTEKLTKRFRQVKALDGLDLEVPEGAIYALLGPNGAGKSTLIKTLLNIWAPDSGAAWLLGVNSRRLRPAELANIGYVSENQRLPDWMTVAEFLRYCKAFYSAWDDDLARKLIELLYVPTDRRLSSLSRGMRIKAALVSALAYRPRLVILDEPFSGLDVLVRDEISETLLGEIAGTTVFLASHDLADLESFASHVGYLHDGRLLFSEEMPSLAARYREVEVTLDSVADVPLKAPLPSEWLNPEQSERVIRFTDSRFDAERVREYFPTARSITTEPLSLRRIFVALARHRRSEHDLAHS
jgi:ABC-2 type transport system ATP-binding protein